MGLEASNFSQLIVFIVFCTLVAVLFCSSKIRANSLRRSWGDWLIDLTGLFIQGILIPAIQIGIGYFLFTWLMPSWKSRLEVGWAGGFFLNFIVVDYLYYWNHRLLHRPKLWFAHQVHHNAKQLDVLATSRNTIWSPSLILYIWINTFFVFLLRDSRGYIVAAGLTAALDLWRHSNLVTPKALCWLKLFLITPEEHAWHHSQELFGINYGANFSLWDRWHHTYFSAKESPKQFGVPVRLPIWRKLIFPVSKGG